MRIRNAVAALVAQGAHPILGTTLKFSSNGTFHISIFEDLHFGESIKTILMPPAIILL